MSISTPPTTLRHVAQATGLSTAAVSLILNGKGRFREETRRRVNEAVHALGYRPNALAKGMVHRRFGTFALLQAADTSHGYLSPLLIDGLEDALTGSGTHLTIARLPDAQLSDAGYVPKILSHLLADGLLINLHVDIPPRMRELIDAASVPAIWLNSRQESDGVHPDDLGGARLATRRLMELGHRRIAYVDLNTPVDADGMHYSTADRRRGYQEVLTEAGLPAEWICPADRHLAYDERVPFLVAALRQRPEVTACLCYNIGAAVPLLIAAAASGRMVGKDLSLISFADGVQAQRNLGLDLALVSTASRDLGRIAVDLLRSRIATGRPVPSCRVPAALIPGATLRPR